MPSQSRQTTNGKAFEFSLLKAFQFVFGSVVKIELVENGPFEIARLCFESLTAKERAIFESNAVVAVKYLRDLEPKLSKELNQSDCLQLEVVADVEGQSGDVRDILAIRSLQNWEIGISAKNNHQAVKHSRLSNNIDFGKKWLDIPCSSIYFEEIKPVFDMLEREKIESNGTKLWKQLGNYHQSVYKPILESFKSELLRINEIEPENTAKRLVEYFIGTRDFYKVIKKRNAVIVQAFNLHGTLNQSVKEITAITKVPRLKLPSRIIEITWATNSFTTLLVTLTEGWAISMRLHNASSRIEPSLKFEG